MYLSRWAKRLLGGWTALGFVFIYAPLMIVAILSFNTANGLSWPPKGLTLKWWRKAFETDAPRNALFYSLKVALIATVLALVLGTLASFAVHRFKFFGRDVVSFLIVLPIALPGIATAIALRSAFDRLQWERGLRTLVISHATFCVVVVYNNVIARLRRMAPNVQEASADLGGDTFQTFWYITFPLVRSSIIAGALLAFALSFDELVVTNFTAGAGDDTLPVWIFKTLFRPKQAPIVNVMATAVILLSIIPVYIAQRLNDSTPGLAGR
jgi:putative spermidine/putrescine transport system permease protein